MSGAVAIPLGKLKVIVRLGYVPVVETLAAWSDSIMLIAKVKFGFSAFTPSTPSFPAGPGVSSIKSICSCTYALVANLFMSIISPPDSPFCAIASSILCSTNCSVANPSIEGITGLSVRSL